MVNRRQDLFLTIITVVFTLLWLSFFVLITVSKSFNESLDDPGVLMTLFLMVFALFTFIFPFAGLYMWFSDNFKIKSKYLLIFVFSLTPWIVVLLVNIRDRIIELLLA